MTNQTLLQLEEDTKIVASARFNKVKRLKRKTWWSLFSISSISISLILVTICENTHGIKYIKPIFLCDLAIQTWVFTVLSSIVTLAISIAISSSRLESEQEKLNDSAVRINRISGRIKASAHGDSKEKYLTLYEKYQSIISENLVNHDNIDHRISRSEIKKAKTLCYYINTHVVQNLSLIPFFIIFYLALSVTISVIHQILVSVC